MYLQIAWYWHHNVCRQGAYVSICRSRPILASVAEAYKMHTGQVHVLAQDGTAAVKAGSRWVAHSQQAVARIVRQGFAVDDESVVAALRLVGLHVGQRIFQLPQCLFVRQLVRLLLCQHCTLISAAAADLLHAQKQPGGTCSDNACCMHCAVVHVRHCPVDERQSIVEHTVGLTSVCPASSRAVTSGVATLMIY